LRHPLPARDIAPKDSDMFDFIRKNNKVLMFLLFLLIIPSFVLFGVEGYTRMNDRGEVVARVAGEDIRQGEWDAAHRREADQLRQSMPNLDPQLLDSPQARFGTLERMIRDRVLRAAADDARLVTGDQRLAAELQRSPMIASLRGPDGKLDMARYRQLAAQQGMTPEMFEEQMRASLSLQQVLAGVTGTAFASETQARVALGAFLERREVQVQRFDAAEFAAKVQPTPQEVEAFYQANPQMFQAPEQVDVEYLVLDAESVMKGITLNEADVRAYFEQNISRVTGPEERRASHILIAAPASAPAEQRQAAKAKAEDILAQVRKQPGRFAELARQHSQDPGSAARGGDLEFFSRGAMVKPFEDAAFALQKGDTSGVVETDFGYHIIRVTDVKVPRQRNFDEMRAQLEADLRKQQAQRKFAETADAFSNAVYEQADSLQPAAEKFNLTVQTATGITRQPPADAKGPLANARRRNVLFSPDSLERKRNTEAVETSSGQLTAARVVRHQPARTLPLAEVSDSVRERLRATRGAELARKAGEEKLAEVQAKPQAASLPPPIVVSRDETRNLPGPIVEGALRADPTALPLATGIDLGNQGYAVVKVLKVIAREAPAAELARQERDQVAQWWASAEGLAYYNLLKERFKVQIRAPRPQQGTS
jgi:peptidyl-prolyl cis-trans isomerase D